jgi:hypothetical protein
VDHGIDYGACAALTPLDILVLDGRRQARTGRRRRFESAMRFTIRSIMIAVVPVAILLADPMGRASSWPRSACRVSA